MTVRAHRRRRTTPPGAGSRTGTAAPPAREETGDADDAGRVGAREEELEETDRDDFFGKFDESDLEFLYQERTSDGDVSHFSKFVRRGS
jgi:hypothetical protein